MEKQIVRIGTFSERLSSLASPVTATVRDAMVGLLDSEAVRVGQSERVRLHDEYVTAAEVVTHARERVDALRSARTAIVARLEQSKTGWLAPLVIGVLMMVCAAATVASDFILSRAVIPWLLSVSPKSLLGIALSVAP